MLIKELILKTAVTKDTIRYYERIGLLSKPKRLNNGYRDYSETTVDQIKFIKMGQSVGFKLSQIKPALPHITSLTHNCPKLQVVISEQLLAIDKKIESLVAVKLKLKKLSENNKSLVLKN